MTFGVHERFGKYELIRRLALGGMAEIFLARICGEEGFSKHLVVKRILPQFCSDRRFVNMFIDEAVLAARINHPNVVHIYDFGRWQGHYFIAMEYVEGLNLHQLIQCLKSKEKSLSAVEVAALGEGMARALNYVHGLSDERGEALNVVHRDISPHNVMLSRRGEVKLMDFGIAKAESRLSRTGTGSIKGKVAYMAPEQARGAAVDQRCDQYALGAVLWESMTGERMFSADGGASVLAKVAWGNKPPIDAVCPSIPPLLARVIERATEYDPEKRNPNPEYIARDLSNYRFGQGERGAIDLGALVCCLMDNDASHSIVQNGTIPLSLPQGKTETHSQDWPWMTQNGDEPYREEDTTSWSASENEVDQTLTLEGPLALTRVMALHALKPENTQRYRLALLCVALGVVFAAPVPLCSVEWPSEKSAKSSLSLVAAMPTMLRSESVFDEEGGGEVRTRSSRAEGGGMVPEVALSEGGTMKAATQIGPLSKRLRLESKVAKLSEHGQRFVARQPKERHLRRRLGELHLSSSGARFDVLLGDVWLGSTPLNGVALPAGRRVLTLRDRIAAVEREMVIEVPAGGRVERVVSF